MTARPRLGLIGCGAIASWAHLPVLRRLPDAELVVVADPDERARARAERIAGVSAGRDAEEAPERDDVDAVVITAPTGVHADLALAAAGAGKHFYVEKPLAVDEAQAAAVVSAVGQAGVIGAVGFNRRFHPAFSEARRFLRAGVIGKVRGVHSAFCEPAEVSGADGWRQQRATGGGALLDLGSHHFDLLRFVLDDELLRLEGSVRSERSEDDSAWVRAELAGGATAQLFFSLASGKADVFEFFGERGVLRADRYVPPLLLWSARRSGHPPRRRPVLTRDLLEWQVRHVASKRDPSYGRVLKAFVARLRGDDVELPSVEDGLVSVEAVLATEASARDGTPVALIPA